MAYEDYNMDFYPYDMSGVIDREQDWKNGIHEDRNGHTHEITEMSDSHLINTIKFFDTLDTTPLKQELKRRKLAPHTPPKIPHKKPLTSEYE